MPNPLQDRIRLAMTGGGNLKLLLSQELNQEASGNRQVYLHDAEDAVRVDLDNSGEPATILWLPWKQGELPVLQPYSIQKAAPGTLFLTYYLSGCKIFAIRGGPVWHIDAPVAVNEFWPQIAGEEWVEENWEVGTEKDVAYLHRAGQPPALWDLSAYLEGGPPTTYGNGNIGSATAGGVVNDAHVIDFYFQASPWARLPFSGQVRSK